MTFSLFTIISISNYSDELWIGTAKGKKDRISLLSENTLNLLREYYKSYKSKDYLFEGRKGCKYSPTSVANNLKKSAQKAGITNQSKIPYSWKSI